MILKLNTVLFSYLQEYTQKQCSGDIYIYYNIWYYYRKLYDKILGHIIKFYDSVPFELNLSLSKLHLY